MIYETTWKGARFLVSPHECLMIVKRTLSIPSFYFPTNKLQSQNHLEDIEIYNLSNNLWLICVLFLPIKKYSKNCPRCPNHPGKHHMGNINPLWRHCWVKTFPIFLSDETTLQRTNISRRKALLKMNFLFARWDMLVPWRVPWCETCFLLFCSKCFHQFVYQILWVWCNINQERNFLRN